MTGATGPGQFDAAEQMARIMRMVDESDKFRAETRKLMAESDKFVSEQRKLIAEAQKHDRDRWIAPVLAAVTVIAALITGFATMVNILHK